MNPIYGKKNVRKPLLGYLSCFMGLIMSATVQADLPERRESAQVWFEEFKQVATDEELYRFLYAMPKGGDLHSHMSGSARTEWFYEWALAQEERGYVYYTRVQINNCRPYGSNEFGSNPYLLLFVNIQAFYWDQLDDCEKSEFVPLAELNETQKEAWLDSMRLDKKHEGRDEFFQTHWQRMNHLFSNPYITAENLVRNMQLFAAEGMTYWEPQIGVRGFMKPDGSAYTADEVADIYRQRLLEDDAVETGMTIRLQLSVLRFSPYAEDDFKWMYEFIYNNQDLWVAVNLVGREDNDKGYPLRFLDAAREMRKQFHGVKLSIHAGEVDEPNFHVRDTLLLGAERIGHGVNLISDPDTMLKMRGGPHMIEINLISNLLLEYVDKYDQHPFPEYLRMGIPVALSTDDRGMWDSNMTDEFYVAVKEFNLSWNELKLLGRNSLAYSFTPEETKSALLDDFAERISKFEEQMKRSSDSVLASDAVSYGFICDYYDICTIQP